MPTSTEAEEHLRVIRSLMEKATIYRSISAPAAALGGVLSIGASFAFGNWWPVGPVSVEKPEHIIEGSHFLALWLGVLAVTALANLYFLWRAAKARRDFFVSPGMRAAARSLLPSYTVAAFGAYWLIWSPMPNFVVPMWIVCHGLGLLATGHFAPRSLVYLGWAFLLAGLFSIGPISSANWPVLAGFPLDLASEAGRGWIRNHALLTGQLWMAVTFGVFHLIYAACTWPRKTGGEV